MTCASELTIREQAREIAPKCAHCGVDALIMSDADAADIVRLDAELEQRNPEMNRSIKGIAYLCAKCLAQMEGLKAAQIRTRHLAALRDRTYNTGLILRVSEGCTFADSSGEYESRNPAVWEMAGKPLARNLWLHGDRGTGKTYLSRCILNRALDVGHTAAEISAVTLMGESVRPNWQYHLRQWADAAYLLVDDIDKAVWTPEGLQALFWLADGRYGRTGLRLIITANYDTPHFRDRLREVANNAQMPGAILERLTPIDKHRMLGVSIRAERQAELPTAAPENSVQAPPRDFTAIGSVQAATNGENASEGVTDENRA